MNNEETQITWNYHNGTKHPNGIFLMKPHFYDPALRPEPYKISFACNTIMFIVNFPNLRK